MGHVTSFAPRVLRGYPTMVAALDEPEALVLRCIRSWVAELRRAAEPLPRLHRMLSAAGAPDAAASIDMLMHVVARTACRPVGIGCPCCAGLAPDEQRLLHAAAARPARRPRDRAAGAGPAAAAGRRAR